MFFFKSKMKKFQETMVGLAFEIAGNMKITLDYSDESIKKVEEILARTNEYYIRTKNDEGLVGISLEFAAYIIAVIEKNHGPGKWKKDDKEFGPDTFPYHWNGRIIFPYIWCMKRIFDGEMENVWCKYQTLVLNMPDDHLKA